MQYPDNPTEWYFWTNRATSYNRDDIAEKYAKYSTDDKPLEDPDYYCRKDDRHITGYKHYQVQRFSAVYICISKMNEEKTHVVLGNADLTRKDFPVKWKELVSAAKERVDRLNSLSAALEISEGGSCAECGGNCAEGDYLCEKCRNE